MKKFTAVLLCIIMAAGIFSSCSNGGKDNSDSADITITLDSHYAETDESVSRAYEKLCNAVIAGESEVKFNIGMSGDVTKLFYTCFPLYSLVSSINYNEDSTGFKIEYFHSPEEHKEIVSQFKEKVDSIMAECEYGKVNINRYIFNVYQYMCSNISVDNSVTSTYETIMQGKGVAASINSMFEYIVLLGGGEASHVLNYSGGGSMISLVKFNGSWLYFDVASEISEDTKALTRFAMDRKRAGASYHFTDGEEVFAVDDDSYSPLSSSSSYTAEDDKITVLCDGETEFVLKFN